MESFHRLIVMQNILYRRYSCKSMQKWFTDAAVIAPGSTQKGFQGKHYEKYVYLVA